MKHLLDVNVLLAAIWVKHAQHAQVKAWLEDKEVVICPISELGFIRISTNKRAFGFAMNDVRQGVALNSHARTSGQVTDHYLADLAAKHGLKLATLDAQLKHPSVELVR